MCADQKESCKSDSCHCQNSGPQVRGFLIPCLLLLLVKNSSHGYQMIERLAQLDYFKNMPDAGVIYRHLRKLEEEEMITSVLEAGEGGPARKVYSITEKGKDCLLTWNAGFKNLKLSIDGILTDLDKATVEL
jgi:PadR family transcriptional regulator